MRYEKMKDCAEELLLRDINDTLDPEVEAEINRRTEEEGDVAALLDRLDQRDAGGEADTVVTPIMTEKQIQQENVSVASVVGNAAVATAATMAAADDSHPMDVPQVPPESEEYIDRETGEVLFPGDEGYEELSGESDDLTSMAIASMRQEERNLVAHTRQSERELDDGREVDW
jgi:hypothetical protein